MPVMEPRATRAWMRRHADEYVDRATGEVNCTALAEGAASEFGNDEIGGPLDDETHWVWEIAQQEGARHEKAREQCACGSPIVWTRYEGRCARCG